MKYSEPQPGFRKIFRKAGNIRLLPIIIIAVVLGGGYMLKQKNDERRQRRAQQEQELNATISELRTKAAEEMKKDGFIGDSGIQAVDKMRAVMEKGAKGNDSDAKIMGVMARFLGTIGTEGKALIEISNRLEQMNAFDFSSYTSKEAIAERRKVAAELSAKNKSLLNFLNSGSIYLRDELKRAGITGSAADAQIRAFEHGQQRQRASTTIVRQADITMAAILTELCDLADAEFGKFTAKKGGEVTFENAKAADKYNALMEKLQKAADEQSAAQQALIDNLKK